jgi:hypothetical protein
MKLTEYKEVTEWRNVTIGYRCDNCCKIHNGNSIAEDWHHFSAHHNSWGKDSWESYEYYTACSPECYAKLLQRAVEEFKEYHDAQIDNFEIDFAKRMSNFLNTL